MRTGSTLAKLLLILVGLVALLAPSATAHEVRPVFLDVRETVSGRYDVTWKRPVFGGLPLPVSPRFAPGCQAAAGGGERNNGSFAVGRFMLACPEGLAGTDIVFDGLSGTMVDGLVRIRFASGEVVTGRVRPEAPVFRTPGQSGGLDVLRTYAWLGVEHILLGFDHLLFVLALVLLVRQWRRLLVTATAFTVAHSITLSLAALGVVHVPVPPVEAMIAVSILLLAVELLRVADEPARAEGLAPARMAFAFGLLHGLGFASALAEIGLPQHEIPLALLAFNLGVEIGQVVFIGALLALGWLCRKLGTRERRFAYQGAVYGIGSLAAFWTIERIASF